MGKKRGVDSLEEVVEGRVDGILIKKIKKDKEIDMEMHDGGVAPPSTPGSINPMERKKQRKGVDKGKRQPASTEIQEPPLKPQPAPQSKANNNTPVHMSSSAISLPEFHLSVFKDLASPDASVREAAVESLVTELQEIQKAYDVLENKELVEGKAKLEAEKDDGLNNCAPSLRYALRRLIRGVSSSRECARQGFALALSILVHQIPNIKVDSLLKLMVDLLEVTSSMKGQDIKDCLLGRLFAYGALVQSDRLIAPQNTLYIKEFVNALISLAEKKRYLQEPAVCIILELVEKLSPTVLNDVFEASAVRKWFEEATDVGNPDALLLALKIHDKIPGDSTGFGKILPFPFSASELFSAEHLSYFSNCLKESTFCQPRVHSVWSVLIKILLPDSIMLAQDAGCASNPPKKHKKGRKSSSSEEEIAKNLQCFCDVVIDGFLLTSSHDRKHLALDVVLLLLQRLPASFIPIVMSFKLVQCLMDILSTKDNWLYKVAQHFLKELSDWVKNDDGKRVAVVAALQKHSNGKFDCITKTRIVKDMIAEFKTEAGCMLFIQSLVNMFVDEGQASEEPSDQSQTTDDNSEIGSIEDKDSSGMLGSSDFLKSWVVESLPNVVKHLKLDPEAQFRVQKEVLKFLAVQGLFSASLGTEVTSFELQEKFKWPKSATSAALCRRCIEQLQYLLANAQKFEEPQSPRSGVEPNDLGSYFMRFLGTLRNIPSVALFRTLSNDDEQAFKKLQDTEARLFKEEKNGEVSVDVNKLHASRHILIQLLLQVLLQPEEFIDAASELTMCCKKAFPASDSLDSPGEDEVDGDSMPELMDVLVDTLLSLLPQSSAPLRSAIEQVFKYFCVDITDDGLSRMLRIIKKDLKPPRHHDADDDDNDNDDDLLGIEEDEDTDEAETGETGESDGQTDDSEAVIADEESGQLSEDSDDSDGGLDDDAMFRMDTYLARIFKEKKNQAGKETAQSQLHLFKLRVLSLLEIYLHENRGKPQVVTVYADLARAFVNLHNAEGSEQFAQRILGILQRKIFKERKYLPKGEKLHLSTLESLLERNLKLASKPFKRKKSTSVLSKKKLSASVQRHKMIIALAQNSTYWILKIIESKNLADSELRSVFDIMQTATMGYFDTKKSQIKSGFLKEIFRRYPRIGQHFFGLVMEKCGSAKSDFRRVEALDMVLEILKPLVPISSDENSQHASKQNLKNHLQKLSHLVAELVTRMPEQKTRRAEVQKFCGKIFQMVSTLNLSKSFLKRLGPEAQSACESQLGEVFYKFRV